MHKPHTQKAIDALLGVAVGDAVGVPFEFRSRSEMAQNPAKDMIGYGTHNQAPGTWSDDSSLTFCLAESLLTGYDLKDMAEKFYAWKRQSYWTARGELFDIGITTSRAITRLNKIIACGELEELKKQKEYGEETENGNGSLMRILPLLFYIQGKGIKEQFEIIWEVSALTHRHIRAAMSCLIYLRLAEGLLNGLGKVEAYQHMRRDIATFWEEIDFSRDERTHFTKVIQNDIRETPRAELKSGGYVIEVLESSIACFLKEDSYEKTILSIINLGHDTDTSAAIAGGLAGLYYGSDTIPAYWVDSLARLEDIVDLGEKLGTKYLLNS